MTELNLSVPQETLVASSSSSDEGIREENTRGSNINLISSSTLNDKGMSLHSFPIESEIFTEKSPLSVQTFLNDGFTGTEGSKKEMGYSSFVITIPPCCRSINLVQTTVTFEIGPVTVDLSRYSTTISDIPMVEKDFKSQGTDTMRKDNFFRIENVSTIAIVNPMKMSSETFHQEISPTNKQAQSSQSLKKLEERMLSLQSVFKKVKVSRELNVYTVKQEKQGFGYVNIKQFFENVGTQTMASKAENTDCSCQKIESLILESEFIGASVNMIRQYPFYYNFLERCYSDRNFGGQFKHLKPKQKNFKRAVIQAYGSNRTHLEAINSVLVNICNVKNDTCLVE